MRFVALVLVAGCGRIGFESRAASSSDAGGDGTASPLVDAPVPCTTWGPFGTPVKLDAAVQSGVDDWSPAPSPDGLELVFYSYRPGGKGDADIYDSVRASTADPWPAATPIASVNTAVRDAEPTLTGDRLELFYATVIGGREEIWVATRSTTSGVFAAPQQVAGLGATGNHG